MTKEARFGDRTIEVHQRRRRITGREVPSGCLEPGRRRFEEIFVDPCDVAVRNSAGAYLVSNRILGSQDRKSTRLNSSHGYISYAVFCLKKKTNIKRLTH